MKKVTQDYQQVLDWLAALRVLQFQYTLTKRYIDEKRAGTVGRAEFTLTIDEDQPDTRKRFEE